MTPFDHPVIGLVVGSYQGCSQALHGRPRARASEAADGRREGGERGRAASGGRWMGARSERARGAGGLHARRTPPLGQRPLAVVGVRHPRAACPSFIDWAAERRASSSAMARLPRTRAAEGLLAGPSRGRRCTPAPYVRGARTAAGLSGARRPRAGWQVPTQAEPTMPRLNSQVLGF